MPSLKKILVFFFSLYALILLIAGLIILLPFVLSTFIYPEKKRGDLVFSIIIIWIRLFFFLTGIRPKIEYESDKILDKPMVYIFNHISYLDALVAVHSLRGRSIRGLGKYEFSGIPLIGLIYSQAVVLVKRGDKEDRARCVIRLKETIAQGTSIFLAPEGTFNSPGKPLSVFYDGAFRIALETQTPLQPMLLLDTHDRMNQRSIFSFNPGPSRVIFLSPFSVDGYGVEDLPLFKEKVFTYMQDALIKHKASWISTQE